MIPAAVAVYNWKIKVCVFFSLEGGFDNTDKLYNLINEPKICPQMFPMKIWITAGKVWTAQ